MKTEHFVICLGAPDTKRYVHRLDENSNLVLEITFDFEKALHFAYPSRCLLQKVRESYPAACFISVKMVETILRVDVDPVMEVPLSRRDADLIIETLSDQAKRTYDKSVETHIREVIATIQTTPGYLVI